MLQLTSPPFRLSLGKNISRNILFILRENKDEIKSHFTWVASKISWMRLSILALLSSFTLVANTLSTGKLNSRSYFCSGWLLNCFASLGNPCSWADVLDARIAPKRQTILGVTIMAPTAPTLTLTLTRCTLYSLPGSSTVTGGWQVLAARRATWPPSRSTPRLPSGPNHQMYCTCKGLYKQLQCVC